VTQCVTCARACACELVVLKSSVKGRLVVILVLLGHGAQAVFGNAVEIVFLKNLNLFFLINFFYVFGSF
jgi:hypothetical protein